MNKKQNTLKDPQLHGEIAIPPERIAIRAYEKWCKRGRPPGTDRQDWVEADKELRAEIAAEAKKRVQSSTERGSRRPTPRSVSRTPDREGLFKLLESLLK